MAFDYLFGHDNPDTHYVRELLDSKGMPFYWESKPSPSEFEPEELPALIAQHGTFKGRRTIEWYVENRHLLDDI